MGVEGVDQEGAKPVEGDQQQLEKLLVEAQAYVTNRQLDMHAALVGKEVIIDGHFIVSGVDGPFDSFQIEVRFRPEFPLSEPAVFETGGRIPKIPDRHVFDGSERCCTGVWEEAYLKPAVHSVAGFMVTMVNDYLVSQTYFEVNGSWPYGDRSHGKLGVIEACCDLIGIDHDPKLCIDMMFYLAGLPCKGHRPCMCGSGKRFRNCHRPHLADVSRRVPLNVIFSLLDKIRSK